MVFVEAPGVGSKPEKKYTQTFSDLEFEGKLQAVKRCNLLAFYLLLQLVVVGSIWTLVSKTILVS